MSSASKIGLLVLAGILAAIAYSVATKMPSGSSTNGGSGTSANVPPVGSVWFGMSFDAATFAIPSRIYSTPAGQTFAMVGHLPRSVKSGEVNARISLDGTTYVNQSVDVQGEGDLIGLTYLPPVHGKYKFEITDIGGVTLASGQIDVR